MITAAILICLAPVAIDGDTLRCGSAPAATTIRLFGIRSVDRTPADQVARARLNLTSAGGVTCVPRGTSYSRIVAVCHNGNGTDVGKDLITNVLVTEWCSFSKNLYGTCL